MNERKDILERVKHLMKEDSGIKVNCSKLARQLNCDRRTVSRYIYITRSGKEALQREYPKKTDGFEHIIEEKVKTTAPAIAIYNYLAKEHGYTGSYSTIKRYIHNLNIEKQKDAVIRFETNPGIQAQVNWKESLKCKTKDGETIKLNIFLLILGFSRTKFLIPTTVVVIRSATIPFLYGSPLPLLLRPCQIFSASTISGVCVIPFKLLSRLCQCFISARIPFGISVSYLKLPLISRFLIPLSAIGALSLPHCLTICVFSLFPYWI